MPALDFITPTANARSGGVSNGSHPGPAPDASTPLVKSPQEPWFDRPVAVARPEHWTEAQILAAIEAQLRKDETADKLHEVGWEDRDLAEELGVSSMVGLRLIKGLQNQLGFFLPKGLLFEHPTARLMAEHLFELQDTAKPIPPDMLDAEDKQEDDELRPLIAQQAGPPAWKPSDPPPGSEAQLVETGGISSGVVWLCLLVGLIWCMVAPWYLMLWVIINKIYPSHEMTDSAHWRLITIFAVIPVGIFGVHLMGLLVAVLFKWLVLGRLHQGTPRPGPALTRRRRILPGLHDAPPPLVGDGQTAPAVFWLLPYQLGKHLVH